MYCLVNHGGRIGFCDHLIGEGTNRYLLGDLREATFEETWNGPAYQELRRQHVRWAEGLDERFEECNWCYRNRYVDFEHLTVPEYAEMIVSSCRTPAHFTSPTETSARTGPLGRRQLPIIGLAARPGHPGS